MTPRVERIGNCELWLGDAREIVPTFPWVEAVVTDQPYGVSVSGSVNASPNGTRRFDFFKGDSDWAAMNALARDVITKTVATNPLSFAIWCGHRQIGFLTSVLEENDYSTRMLFWRKTCPAPMPPKAGWVTAVETCVYAYKPGRYWGGNQYDANIFDCDNYRHGQPDKVDHPTQKPLQLMIWQIERIVSPGAVVLDPFMGSGTTGVACAKLGRRFIGIEIHEPYFNIAVRRIEAAYRQADLFVAAPVPIDPAEQRAIQFFEEPPP
jgi:site-specific DNA-methyltransferase (adenine-specific)